MSRACMYGKKEEKQIPQVKCHNFYNFLFHVSFIFTQIQAKKGEKLTVSFNTKWKGPYFHGS